MLPIEKSSKAYTYPFVAAAVAIKGDGQALGVVCSVYSSLLCTAAAAAAAVVGASVL